MIKFWPIEIRLNDEISANKDKVDKNQVEA